MSENKNTAAELAEFVRLDRYSYEIVVGGEVVGIVWRCGNESKWFAREPAADKSPDFLYPAPAHSRLEATELFLAWLSEQADIDEVPNAGFRDHYDGCWTFQDNHDLEPAATVFRAREDNFGFTFTISVYDDEVTNGLESGIFLAFDSGAEVSDRANRCGDLTDWLDDMGTVLDLVRKWHAAGHYGPRLALLGEAHHA